MASLGPNELRVKTLDIYPSVLVTVIVIFFFSLPGHTNAVQLLLQWQYSAQRWFVLYESRGSFLTANSVCWDIFTLVSAHKIIAFTIDLWKNDVSSGGHQYRKFHCGDKTVLWPSYFPSEIFCTVRHHLCIESEPWWFWILNQTLSGPE